MENYLERKLLETSGQTGSRLVPRPGLGHNGEPGGRARNISAGYLDPVHLSSLVGEGGCSRGSSSETTTVSRRRAALPAKGQLRIPSKRRPRDHGWEKGDETCGIAKSRSADAAGGRIVVGRSSRYCFQGNNSGSRSNPSAARDRLNSALGQNNPALKRESNPSQFVAGHGNWHPRVFLWRILHLHHSGIQLANEAPIVLVEALEILRSSLAAANNVSSRFFVLRVSAKEPSQTCDELSRLTPP
jgi:hypothetical protein